jgi:hypothetical protein
MASLFIGMTVANLLLLCTVFGMGLYVIGADGKPTGVYAYHISLAIAATFVTLGTHVGVFMYFMATCKWLQAATDKAALDVQRFITPAFENKRRVFACLMAPIVVVMLASFAGAGADPALAPLWSPKVHLAVAAAAIVVNLFAAMLEFKFIKAQGRLMEDALTILNNKPGVVVEPI